MHRSDPTPSRGGLRAGPRLLVALLACLTLPAALGCGDPGKALQAALDAGRKAAVAQARGGAGSEDWSDDESAKKASDGVSLGEATRLYYQFIDSSGRVAFVERLSEVPESWRDKVGFVEMESPPPLSPAMAERTRDQRYAANGGGRAAGAKRAVAAADPVILYSAEWCGWCRKAKRHLDGLGVDYQIRDVDIPANMQDLVAKTGQRGIPVLDVGGRIVTGFSADAYDRLIRSRG